MKLKIKVVETDNCCQLSVAEPQTLFINKATTGGSVEFYACGCVLYSSILASDFTGTTLEDTKEIANTPKDNFTSVQLLLANTDLSVVDIIKLGKEGLL